MGADLILQLPKLSFLRRAPTQARGARRILQILNATEALVGEIPFDHVTLHDIAKRARVTNGTIYFFFADRTAIYYSLIEMLFRRSFAVYELTEQELAQPLIEFLPRLRNRLLAEWDTHAKKTVDLYYAYRTQPPVKALLDDFNTTAHQQMLRKVSAEFHFLPESRQDALARVINHALMSGLDDVPNVAKARVLAFRKEWFAMLLAHIKTLRQQRPTRLRRANL
jgi:AcrR family transcriptional regulator